jgi:hypothetical protein
MAPAPITAILLIDCIVQFPYQLLKNRDSWAVLLASRGTTTKTAGQFPRVVLGNRAREVKEKFISEEMVRGERNKRMQDLLIYFELPVFTALDKSLEMITNES